MEKTYGIEAARAQLGEIADHARRTGQTVSLTRHNRPVAVIGPVGTVQPAAGVEVWLLLGNQEAWTCNLPAVPRRGDSLLIESTDGDEDFWTVVNVQWDVRPGEPPSVNVIAELTTEQ